MTTLSTGIFPGADITDISSYPSFTPLLTPGYKYDYLYSSSSSYYSKTTRTTTSTVDAPTTYPTPIVTVDSSFFETCRNTKIRDIVGPRIDVIIVYSTDSITSAFHTLVDNNIVSAPVFDPNTNLYIAFLSMLDIIAFLVETYQFQVLETSPNLEELVLQERFRNTPVSALGINRFWRCPFYSVNQDMTVEVGLNLFLRTRADQIALLDANGNFVNILTQHMFVNWLAKRPSNEIGQITSQSIQSLRLGIQRVVRVHKNRYLLHAFMRMYDANVSGVAIVDNTDRLIGNISTTDLKEIGGGAENFRKLYMRCGDFINQKHQNKDIPKLICVFRDQLVKDVLDLFVRYDIHRVYVINREDNRPVGVISDGDVLNLFGCAVPNIQPGFSSTRL